MEENLKPCPFCGCDVMYLCNRFDVYGIEYNYVFCNTCKTSFSNEDVEESEFATIEWWNTRHERTCANAAAMRDVAFTCSECGTYYSFNRRNSQSKVRFCPRCSARVISEVQ